MRFILCLCVVLLTTSTLFAETYSWVDDTGTWNFSDDYYSVPKKYRKGIKVSGDVSAPDSQLQSPVPEKKHVQVPGGKGLDSPGGEQLYSGKTQSVWRKEFDLHESELKRLELKLEQLQATINKSDKLPREQRSEMYREYEALRVEYNDKYKTYSELIESARKAGLTVEIKK